MKLAFVIGLYPYQIGGAEMQAREIALQMQRNGHEVSYICYSYKPYSSSEFPVKIITGRKRYDIFYISQRKQLFKALDEIKPHAVYHRAFVPFSGYVAQWCKKKSVPFYFHCADIYTLIRDNKTIKNILQNQILKYTLNSATGVICQNVEQYHALERFKLPNVRIIYNIHPRNQQPINHKTINNIVWIAKFESSKQPSVFVEFAERCKDKNYTFTMFSSKFEDTLSNNLLLKIIRENPNIKLIENKDNEYINDYLCKYAKVLINTSISEGISNTFIQAWMRGVPVVSLNSNPNNWFDSHPIGMCCNGDIYKIDENVDRLLNEDTYEHYSKNSVLFSENNFIPEVITPQILEFMNL